MIEIQLNEHRLNLAPSTPLLEALALGKVDLAQPFAVAINGEFVPKSQYEVTQLKNGDQLDVVSPVGGG